MRNIKSLVRNTQLVRESLVAYDELLDGVYGSIEKLYGELDKRNLSVKEIQESLIGILNKLEKI